jgi:hypothetical protein
MKKGKNRCAGQTLFSVLFNLGHLPASLRSVKIRLTLLGYFVIEIPGDCTVYVKVCNVKNALL